ncbi:MAG: HAD-IA family hydrolase [candidate division Zixibacteria bacterium]|nr:HAD-IA family hydrolase [candidate division Zixibacteria bacterium]
MNDNDLKGATPSFEGVIFDMDGVLVDSEPVHLESTIRMMRESFGIDFTAEDNQEFLGSTDRHMYETLKRRHNLAPSRDELIERRKAIYVEMLQSEGIPWRNGILDLVTTLRQQRIRVGMASSGLRWVIEMILKTGGVRDLLEVVVTGDDVITPKPAPDIYAEAIRQLGLPASSCAAIEDTDVGVSAANAAGAFTIAFPAPSTEHMDFSHANRRVTSVDDIRQILL